MFTEALDPTDPETSSRNRQRGPFAPIESPSAPSAAIRSGTYVARMGKTTGKTRPWKAPGTLRKGCLTCGFFLERKTGFEPATLTLAR